MTNLDKILELESKATVDGFDVDVYQDLIFLDYVRQNIRQICLELKAARECITLLTEQRYEFTARVDRALQKYNEATNGK